MPGGVKEVVDVFLGTFSGGQERQMWQISYSTTSKVVKDGRETNDSEYNMVVVGTIEQIVRWLRAKGGEIKYFHASRLDQITDVSGGK